MLKALVSSVVMLSASTALADDLAKGKRIPAPKIAIVMTAVTLADECGGTAPYGPPAPIPAAPASPAAPPKVITAKAEQGPKADSQMEDPSVHSKAKSASMKRRCEQTSMQLSVVAPAKVPATKIKVTKVELFDDSGASLGVLTASNPRVWTTAKSKYDTWSESVKGGQSLSVSYALSQPQYASPDRYNKTYTLKATISVGATQQTLSTKDVSVQVYVPTTLPPGVKT